MSRELHLGGRGPVPAIFNSSPGGRGCARAAFSYSLALALRERVGVRVFVFAACGFAPRLARRLVLLIEATFDRRRVNWRLPECNLTIACTLILIYRRQGISHFTQRHNHAHRL